MKIEKGKWEGERHTLDTKREHPNKNNLSHIINHINLPLVLISKRGFLVATMEHLESNLGAMVRQDVGRRVGIYPVTKIFYINVNPNPQLSLTSTTLILMMRAISTNNVQKCKTYNSYP